jgi:putative aminopeptidase FrvX
MEAGLRAILLIALAAAAAAQSVQFQTLNQSVIEQRLGAYTTKNATREAEIRTLFEEAKCKDDSLSEQVVKGTKWPNLICTLKGTSDSMIVVGAHFDFIDNGSGLVDNWSGASLLPSFYESLSATPRKHTIVFVAFTGEEQGLMGSRAFVKELGPRKADVKAMINLDTVGLGPTEVWLSHADPQLAKWLFGVAANLKIPASAMNVDGVGTTDSEPFREKKIPAMTVHSLTQATLRVLHSPADKIEAIRMDDYYQTYRLLAAYLAVIDQKLD